MNPPVTRRLRHPCLRIPSAGTQGPLLLPSLTTSSVGSAVEAIGPRQFVAAVLKSVFAVGALCVVTQISVGAPTLVASQANPATVTVGQAITPISFNVTEMTNLGSWKLAGS